MIMSSFEEEWLATNDPSMSTSPNSFSMTAIRLPCWAVRI
uniref:COBW domain-containing protein 1-like n=1 Tax=Rhizophora mucronata TaxID=61149 RepID=A0A2P2JNE2_RHIMU